MTDTNRTTTIIGIAGSLRKGSFNAALLRAAAEAASSDTRVEIASIREIPLYDGDVEAEEGIPESVLKLKDRVASADGLLLVTPEYNNSMPGVFKNAIDWLSRPPKDIGRVFGNRPLARIIHEGEKRKASRSVLRACGHKLCTRFERLFDDSKYHTVCFLS